MKLIDYFHHNQNAEYIRGKRNGLIELLIWCLAVTIIISFFIPYFTHKPIAEPKTILSNFGFSFLIYSTIMPIVYHLVNKLLQKKY